MLALIPQELRTDALATLKNADLLSIFLPEALCHGLALYPECPVAWLIAEMKSACFHIRTILANNTKSMRSAFLHVGRLTCLLSMMSCWRNSAFSAMSSDLFLPRSVSVSNSSEEVDGFVQRIKREESIFKQLQIGHLR